MGLAASQGRYLCLTARMSDLIYEGQQISQQRLALSSQSTAAANAYNDAMNNKVMQANIINENGEMQSQQLTYDVLTSQDPFSGLSMRIVDLNGRVVVPQRAYKMTASGTDENGNPTLEVFDSASQFLTKYMHDLSKDKINEMGSWDLPEIKKYFEENYPNSGLSLSVKGSYEDMKADGERFTYDENCVDPKYLQEMLSSGKWLLQQANPESDKGWDEMVWQGSSKIQEVMDTSDDAAAEAKYESIVKDIQKKDKVLELRLEQIQTEESAVEAEIDSIKDVIQKNIEGSFGTFG